MDGHWEDGWCWGSGIETHLELLGKANIQVAIQRKVRRYLSGTLNSNGCHICIHSLDDELRCLMAYISLAGVVARITHMGAVEGNIVRVLTISTMCLHNRDPCLIL